jgi:hypothetical protein
MAMQDTRAAKDSRRAAKEPPAVFAPARGAGRILEREPYSTLGRHMEACRTIRAPLA